MVGGRGICGCESDGESKYVMMCSIQGFVPEGHFIFVFPGRVYISSRFILFYFILFSSIFFYFVLICSILFYFFLFSST